MTVRLVYRQAGNERYRLCYISSHGTCWHSCLRVLRSCYQATWTSSHAGSVSRMPLVHPKLTLLSNRLGITSFMVNEGLVRLEEVRGENGVLENVYVRVCRVTFPAIPNISSQSCFHIRSTEKRFLRKVDPSSRSFFWSSKSARVLPTAAAQGRFTPS